MYILKKIYIYVNEYPSAEDPFMYVHTSICLSKYVNTYISYN